MRPWGVPTAAPAHFQLPAILRALQAIQFSTADRFKIVGSYFSEQAPSVQTRSVQAAGRAAGHRWQEQQCTDTNRCRLALCYLAVPHCRHHSQRQRQLCLRRRLQLGPSGASCAATKAWPGCRSIKLPAATWEAYKRHMCSWPGIWICS